MKKLFLWGMVISFLIFAASCSKGGSPLAPQNPIASQENSAVLIGNINNSGSSFEDLNSISVGIQGTSISVNPNSYGDFQINAIPTGNIVLEVLVGDVISNLGLEDVKSGDEVMVNIVIQADNQAVLLNTKKNEETTVLLNLEIQPKKWNISWTESTDYVHVQINGEGFDKIDLDLSNVKMIGPNLEEIIPDKTQLGGGYFKAFFQQKNAITLIDDPKRWEIHTITVTVIVDSVPIELSDTITIVGKKASEGELFFDIRPKKWNTAWTESTDLVQARISGEGFDDIKETVSFIGPTGTVITTSNTETGDNFFKAFFWQKDVITLITDPKKGDKPVIQIIGSFISGGDFNLTYSIEIVGKKE